VIGHPTVIVARLGCEMPPCAGEGVWTGIHPPAACAQTLPCASAARGVIRSWTDLLHLLWWNTTKQTG
jgi:hypothetical protein